MARRRHQAGEPNLFALRCSECGEYLVRTPSGFLACPNGYGKLVREESVTPVTPEEPTLFDGPPAAGAE